MKKQDTERILSRKLARELRGEELARATGRLSEPQLPLKPIKTITASQPPDSIVDGYET
jgi:hypothetical protein